MSPPIRNQVLYIDHTNHPSPLSHTYHATASRHLSASLSPSSTVTEIDTAYCPQCLCFYNRPSSSAQKGRCTHPQCRLCPICTCPLGIVIEGEEMMYRCGYCRWTSRECGVTAGKDKTVDDLGRRLEARMREEEGKGEDVFDLMMDSWKSKVQEEERRRRHGDNGYPKSGSTTKGHSKFSSWSIETLERQLLDKKQEPVIANADCFSPTQQSQTKNDNSTKFPVRIPLRPKKSRRCQAQLAAGRSGILIKPKVHPLEGDSSQKTGHGKWWKKDSSAVHVVPKVTILNHIVSTNNDHDKHSLLLKVKNPTLGLVTLRFNNSSFSPSQPQHDRLLIEPYTQYFVKPLPLRLSLEQPTEWIGLDLVEDAFLELGKSRRRDPPVVTQWDPNLSSDGGTTTHSTLTLLAVQDDTAWLELTVTSDKQDGLSNMPHTDNKEEAEDGKLSCFYSMPLRMEVQVGNGSWESSLIKPIRQKEECDFVKLDLILVSTDATVNS